MNKMKKYKFKFKYVKRFFDNVSLKDDDIIDINILKDEDGFLVSLFCADDKIYDYKDNGETIGYLKKVARFLTVSKIAFAMDVGCSFDINDNRDNLYGVSKIENLGNQYLLIGGYKHWTVLLDITGMKKEKMIDNIMECLFQYKENYGFADLKKMYLLIDEVVAKNIESSIFSKPYICFCNK